MLRKLSIVAIAAMLSLTLSGLVAGQTPEESYHVEADVEAEVEDGNVTVMAEVHLGNRAPWRIQTHAHHEGDPAGEWLIRLTGTTEAAFPSLTATYESADDSLPTQVGSTQTLAEPWDAGEDLDIAFAMAPVTADHGLALLRVSADEVEYGFENAYSVKTERLAGDVILVNITAQPVVCCSDGTTDPADEFDWPATPEDVAPAPEDSLPADGDPIAEDEDGNPDLFGGGFTIQATTTLNGYVYIYRPGTTTTVPCRLCKVKIYDDDSTSGNEYLGSAILSYGGYLSFPTGNDDAFAGQDPYFVVELDYSTAPAKLMNAAGAFYTHQTGVIKKDCPNTSCSITTTLSLSGDKHYAFWAWEAMARSWQTWKNAGYTVPKVNVEYPAAVTSALTDYANSKIRIPSYEGHNQFTHSHEYGHWAMYKAQNNYLAPGTACATINTRNNAGCAWREGFADFSALVTFNTQRVTFYDGSWINMESMTCSYTPCTFETEKMVPARVTGTLNDLWDVVPDGTQDTASIAYTFTTIVARLRAGTSVDIGGYFNLWKTQGATQETHFRNVASQNTIVV